MQSYLCYRALALYLIFWVLYWIPVTGLAQRMDIPQGFEHFSNTDGLSQGMVNAIHQDRRGFLWVGTKDGLNRYDGYQFKVFREDPFDSTTISGNYIEVIYEDQYGILWAGTEEGLNRYDPRKGTFTQFRQNTYNLSSESISAIAEEPAAGPGAPQVLWVGTNAGLHRMEIFGPQSSQPTYAITPLSGEAGAHVPFSGKSIRTLIVDSRGWLWVSTDDALFRTKGPYVNGKPVIFRQIPSSTVPRGNFPYNQFCSFMLDPAGTLWIGSGSAVARVHQESADSIGFQVFFYPDGGQLSRVDNMAMGPEGKIWIIMSQGPSLAFDTRSGEFETLGSRYSQFTSGYDCTQVYYGRNRNIWLGTNGFGLLKYNLEKDQFHTYTKSQVVGKPPRTSYVSAFLPATNGDGVIVNMGGLYRLGPQQEQLVPANMPPDKENNLNWMPLPGNKYFFERIKQKEYLIYDPRYKSAIPVRQVPSNRVLAVETVVGNPRGDIYLVEFEFPGAQTKEGFYFLHWNKQTKSWSEFRLADSLSAPPLSRTFGQCIIDHKGSLWLPNREGLVHLGPTTQSLKVYRHDPSDPHSLSSSHVKSVLPDPVFPERYLWVGTNSGGLNRLSLQSGQFIHYAQEDGLPNSVIYGILPDSDGHLWVSTNQGLSQVRLNEEREAVRFQNYTREDGLPGNEFNTNAYYKTADGALFFGGVDGFVWFHPDSLRSTRSAPPLVITDFQLDYQSVSHLDPGSVLSRPISETEEIILHHNQDAFAFEFAALDLSAPSRNRYAYYLENFDEGWKEAGSNRRAVYTNVPPGTYWLRAKASNGEGAWNEEGAVVKIVILPPWWQTWWAYLLFTLLVAALLAVIRQSELNRRKLKNEAAIERARAEEKRRQAEKVEAQSRKLRTAFKELKEKNEEVISTQQKLIVQNKLATLGQLIAGIAHEIKNPLNFINNFSEISVEMAEELREELEKYRDQINAKDFNTFQEILDNIRQSSLTTQQNGQRALGIIRNLMDLSRGTEATFRPVSLHGLLDENIKLAYHGYRALVPSFNVEIQKDYAPGLPPVEVVPPDFGRVLLNILNNACYAVHQKQQESAEGYEPTLKVSTRLNGEEVQIRIRDNGPGLPPEAKDKIFTAFFTTKPSGEGNTGLGLSISYDIVVNKHGGRLEADSEAGEYTEFIISLPLKQSN